MLITWPTSHRYSIRHNCANFSFLANLVIHTSDTLFIYTYISMQMFHCSSYICFYVLHSKMDASAEINWRKTLLVSESRRSNLFIFWQKMSQNLFIRNQQNRNYEITHLQVMVNSIDCRHRQKFCKSKYKIWFPFRPTAFDSYDNFAFLPVRSNLIW